MSYVQNGVFVMEKTHLINGFIEMSIFVIAVYMNVIIIARNVVV